MTNLGKTLTGAKHLSDLHCNPNIEKIPIFYYLIGYYLCIKSTQLVNCQGRDEQRIRITQVVCKVLTD